MRDTPRPTNPRLPDPALPPPPWAARIPRWAWLLAFAAADRALGEIGRLLTMEPGGLAVVRPSAGLALFALLVCRRRTWPAVLALAFVLGVAGSVAHGRQLLVAVAYNGANLAEAVAAWWVVVRLGDRPTLRTLRGALVLVLGPAAALAAVSAAAHLALFAGAASSFTHERFWMFWAGSSLGILFVTTLLVEWATPGRPLLDSREARLSAAGIAASFALAVLVMRARGVLVDEVVLSPPLVWAALRFGPRGAVSALGVAVLAVFGSAAVGGGHMGALAHLHGVGPNVLAMQIFLALGAAPILAAAAVGAERRAAEERRVMLERAFDHTPDPAGVVEEDGTVVWANEAMARDLDVPRGAIVGKRIWELTPGGDAATWRERWERAKASGAVVEEAKPGPDGQPVRFEISSTMVDVGGRRLLIAVFRDLTDRHRAEAASRLAALGTLAAGVAHEINNPLAYVVANLAHVHDRLEVIAASDAAPGELRAEVLDPLAEAEEGARRVRDIVRQLRTFARPDAQAGPVDPARALRGALAMANNEIRHRARVVTEVADTPPVLGSENRMTQVFVNLLVNAAQAIPVGNAAGNAVRATLRVRGDDVVAEISDTGGGMTAETRARVFDPFFTTKGPGEGTGLGLAISHSIVAAMGGRIEVDSTPGEGSTFRVLLPAARGEAPPPPEPPPRAVRAAGDRRRVLVVDDEPLVSRAVARMLEADADVAVADRARQALERVRSGERFDAIVCDLMMPDLSGMELHAALLQLDPAIADRMVFVTGGAFTEAAQRFLERIPNARLEKPIDRAALREAVRRIA